METKELKLTVKTAIENYQCSGCMNGGDTSCFASNDSGGVGCGKHYAGTMITTIGKIFLGLPNGFNRLGDKKEMKPNIYETFDSSDWKYNMWNIPVWKYLNQDGHTIVRGVMPRRNDSFIHIFLENCLDKINCLEITQDDVDGMD